MSKGKYVGIWQSDENVERHFVKRLFEPYISEHILDGEHRIVKDNAILFDAWVHANDPSYYAAFAGKNAFLFHLSDEFYELPIERYVHFRGVFRFYWSSVLNPKHVMTLPLGVSSVSHSEDTLPASERLYAWSFVGDANKCTRPEVIRQLASVEPHFAYSTSRVRGINFWNRSMAGAKRIPRPEFMRLLGQSAFAPSPMGNVNLESFRIYEALEAGAIPIVEKRLFLNYFNSLLGANHPIPTVRSWSEAKRLVSRMMNDPHRLNAIQKGCYEWWKSYQSELVRNIGHFLDERSAASEQVVPLRSKLALLPGWQYWELLRHHTLRALFRRVRRQLTRVLLQRKWRETFPKAR